jgi:hypothetical protein
MRKQLPIYTETQSSNVRNKAINNVNTSSDFCIYTAPEFYISGATKIPFSIETCNLSGTSYTAMESTLSATCFSAYSLSTCFCGLTWNNLVYSNNDLAYSGEILTSISSANTFTQSNYNTSVLSSLVSLGYPYSLSGTSIISLPKPYGINSIDFELCVDANYDSGCTTGTCGVCTTACSLNYPYMTSGSSGVYFFGTTKSSVDLSIVFTGNMDSFDVQSSSDTIFKYSIFKYNPKLNGFEKPAIYISDDYAYSAVSVTSSITMTISSTTLNLDGDYLIKGNFICNYCTDILGRLGERYDTSQYSNGNLYSLYNEELDYYFIGLTSAMTPTFLGTLIDNAGSRLYGITLFPSYDDQTNLSYNINFIDSPIIALNGLVLAKNFDYSISSNTITFSYAVKKTDVVTIIGSIGDITAPTHNDLIIIRNPIASGATGSEGTNSVYYNTTTGKNEVYTSLTPRTNNQVIITLNGVILAPNIDYYQSISNPKRFILEGTIIVTDVINLYYLPKTNVVDNLYSNNLTVTWEVAIKPQLANGEFTLEVSTGNTFTTLVASSTTEYIAGVSVYSSTISISGVAGTDLYYRVKNVKNYENLTGDIIASEAYSEIIPITIMSNAINSY